MNGWKGRKKGGKKDHITMKKEQVYTYALKILSLVPKGSSIGFTIPCKETDSNRH